MKGGRSTTTSQEQWRPTNYHNLQVTHPAGGEVEVMRVYRRCGLRRRRDRIVPPAVVLVQLCELVLRRGMPQGLPMVWLAKVS
ncbi:hypothetical protein Taro_047561 [Colocasia esculenta]|uniref:Uncharacterized protein n=1 Tax=Colocasia esculenta TaxID=4460 RepID=A0A843X416_COLES|nr:hypothetical protein [Colocasia esculenta]